MNVRKKSILLTGPPGCGKTTLIKRVIKQLRDLRMQGFYTEEVRGNDGKRVGFNAIGLSGYRTILAHVNSNSRCRVGRYGVEVGKFEDFIASELNIADKACDLIVIDEIGKMECFSPLFEDRIQEMFAGDVPILASIAARGGGLINSAKERDDVDLITVTPQNRDELVDEIERKIRT